LQLTAFGRFSGQVLDFTANEHALHVVYGNNEAGKSTALRAIRGLLFGIPVQSQDTFVHTGADLRLGACIVDEQNALEFVRRKGRKNTLLDTAGQALNDDALAPFLGGADLSLFDAMFGLDHNRLRDGALSLLALGGKVGATLFGASLGTAHLQLALTSLRSSAEEIFTSRGRTRPLNVEIEQLRKARELVNAQATPPHVYVEHRTELERVQREAVLVSETRRQIAAKRRELELGLRILPLVAQRNAYRDQLQTFGHVPPLPQDVEQQVQAASRAHNDAQARQSHARREVQRLEGLLATKTLDSALLAIPEETIRELTERLGSARKAKIDLPKRQAELDAAYAEIRGLLARLGHAADVDKLADWRLTKDEEAWVRRLIRERTQYDTRLATLGDKLARSEASLSALKRALAKQAEEVDVRPLDGALIRAQKHVELEGQLERAKAQLDSCDRHSTAVVERLSPWLSKEAKGTLPNAELWGSALPVTRELSMSFARRRAAAAERLTSSRTETAELLERQAELQQALVSAAEEGQLPSDEGLTVLRQRRDSTIERVATLLAPAGEHDRATPEERATTAELLRERVRGADAYVDFMRLSASQLAEQQVRHSRVLEMQARVVARRQREEELQSEVAAIDEEWARLWRGSHFLVQAPEHMLALLDLLAERESALVLRSEAHALVRRLERSLAEVVAELSNELSRVGEQGRMLWETLPQFVARLEGVVQTRKDSNQERRDTAQRLMIEQEAAEEAQRELSALKENGRAHKSEWLRATKRLGTSKDAGPEELGSSLDALVDAFHRFDEAQALERRINGIKRDARELSEAIAELASSVGAELDITADLAGLERLIAAYQREAEAAQEHRRLVAEFEQRKRALEQVELECAQSSQTFNHWLRLADATTLEELTNVVDRVVQWRRLQRDIAEEERKILAQGEGEGLPALLARCEGLSSAAAQAELSILAEQASSLEGMWEELTRRRVHLEQALEKLSVGAVQASEELEAQVAKVRSTVRKYLRLRLASTLVDREIERYRQENQGPVLNRVQHIFPALTLGRYQSVTLGFDGSDEPILKCVNAEGREIGIEALSDGTRDQLYLSLRIASLEQYFKHNKPMPLVLDDAFIHFDDQRAKAALETLAAFASTTQVLFFTHHRRMLELLRDNNNTPSNVVFHELHDAGVKVPA
jgi:uncharacterized protein YhaN